ncbi:zinc ABC transporter permease AztB [Aeromicrobium sp. CTD01-1L150]|uniref:zinc ABC transporter permease AztB n=1 Tax=Aeromicrobium sp. CTD01-1L150 TaxID=3341830 RepID=UPI0035BEB8DB
MDLLLDPFAVTFVRRAAIAGVLVSVVCACVGTWVVLRGMAFLGDAMSHGMLPGIALASLLGANLYLGAAVAAAVMAAGVTLVQRSPRLSHDTTIGLMFVGMLALGVIIVSSSQSFAVDLTAFLFGDVLGVQRGDLWLLGAAAGCVVLVSVVGHRAFLALALDPRISATTGLRPQLTHAVLLGLVTVAIVSSFSVVGTLLVFGMLIAPPAAAVLWASRATTVMVAAALIGIGCTHLGLLVSWHAGTAAGATIAATTVAAFFCSLLASLLAGRRTVATPAPLHERTATA